jgi:hypothetical protein
MDHCIKWIHSCCRWIIYIAVVIQWLVIQLPIRKVLGSVKPRPEHGWSKLMIGTACSFGTLVSSQDTTRLNKLDHDLYFQEHNLPNFIRNFPNVLVDVYWIVIKPEAKCRTLAADIFVHILYFTEISLAKPRGIFFDCQHSALLAFILSTNK